MKRTQLYLDEDLWITLRAMALQRKTTVSDLVRQAVRERFIGDMEQRRQAMRAFVGSRKTQPAVDTPEKLIRDLRRGKRISTLFEQ